MVCRYTILYANVCMHVSNINKENKQIDESKYIGTFTALTSFSF